MKNSMRPSLFAVGIGVTAQESRNLAGEVSIL